MSVKIHPEIQLIKNYIIETRRNIHQHPELSFKEFRTAKLISNKLLQLGIETKSGVGKTGVIGDLISGNHGPTIALRADMDALPIQETGKSPFKSIIDGVMHACGHDAHVAMLLGAAEALSSMRDEINGVVFRRRDRQR